MHKGRGAACCVVRSAGTPDLLRGQLEPVHAQVLLGVLGDSVGVAELALCACVYGVCVCVGGGVALRTYTPTSTLIRVWAYPRSELGP